MVKFKDFWDPDKDGSRKRQRSFARFAIIATGVFVLLLFIKTDNVIRWIEAGFTLHRQEKQIEALRRDNERLDSVIGVLSKDRDSLERFARETYYFAEPGDDIYIEKK